LKNAIEIKRSKKNSIKKNGSWSLKKEKRKKKLDQVGQP
jgi:hypothetical protein